MKYYLQSLVDPKTRFEIVSRDKATNKMKLLGKEGVEFEQEVTKDTLERLKYKIITEEPSHG